MVLTEAGKKVIKANSTIRRKVAYKLIHGKIVDIFERDVEQGIITKDNILSFNIVDYVGGVCYDAAAFVKYLLSPKGRGLPARVPKITKKELQSITSQNWISNLSSGSSFWSYGESISPGSVVTFRRLHPKPFNGQEVFHAAIAIGGTKIRGINGNRLGNGWKDPADLTTQGLLTVINKPLVDDFVNEGITLSKLTAKELSSKVSTLGIAKGENNLFFYDNNSIIVVQIQRGGPPLLS